MPTTNMRKFFLNAALQIDENVARLETDRIKYDGNFPWPKINNTGHELIISYEILSHR